MILAWHGIELELPARCSPVKIEGTQQAGFVLAADLHRPRLGVRWFTPRSRRADPRKAVMDALRNEVGMLASEEATEYTPSGGDWEHGLLYLEPEPPGRDVWTGYSRASDRVVQVVHHARRRDGLLREKIAPTVRDALKAEPRRWSVFELSCQVGADWKLKTHELKAGDLALEFERKLGWGRVRDWMLVRQMAVARLALQRRPMEKWLEDIQKRERKLYRSCGEAEPAQISLLEREVSGLGAEMRRRRRFIFMRLLAPRVYTLVLHDEARDRLVTLHGTDERALAELGAGIGWAWAEGDAEDDE